MNYFTVCTGSSLTIKAQKFPLDFPFSSIENQQVGILHSKSFYEAKILSYFTCLSQGTNVSNLRMQTISSLIFLSFGFYENLRLLFCSWFHHRIPPMTIPAWNAPSPTFKILSLELRPFHLRQPRQRTCMQTPSLPWNI